MKKTNKSNPLKTFNDNKAMAYKKAGGAMKAFKKSLPKAQMGMDTGRRKKNEPIQPEAKMATLPAGRVTPTMQGRQLAENDRRGYGPGTGAAEVSRRNMKENLTKAVGIAAVNAGSPGIPNEMYKTDNIRNNIPRGDIKGYLSQNPKVLDEMDQFTKQRLQEANLMPGMKKGGVVKRKK